MDGSTLATLEKEPRVTYKVQILYRAGIGKEDAWQFGAEIGFGMA